jgi:hypothetical protein
MRRMVWVAIGAAGGVLAYRRAQTLIADARERGVVLSAQQAGLSAISALAAARNLAAQAERTPAQPAPGDAAARVLRTSKQGER